MPTAAGSTARCVRSTRCLRTPRWNDSKSSYRGRDADAARARVCVLARADGDPLPGWTAGAHIDVYAPAFDRRSYSLIETYRARHAEHPTAYRIAVLLEAKSRGGSAFMHGLKVGDRITISPPSNNFPLVARRSRAGGRRHRRDAAALDGLRAGRIEAAVFVSLRRTQPQRTGVPSRDRAAHGREGHHSCRRRSGRPLRSRGLDGAATRRHAALSLRPAADDRGSHRTAPSASNWPEGRLHFEIFASPEEKAGDASFEVELKSSGRVYEIPPGKTILDVLIDAGEEPMHDCKRGDCGICQTTA